MLATVSAQLVLLLRGAVFKGIGAYRLSLSRRSLRQADASRQNYGRYNSFVMLHVFIPPYYENIFPAGIPMGRKAHARAIGWLKR
jgi:hypothetical protein